MSLNPFITYLNSLHPLPQTVTETLNGLVQQRTLAKADIILRAGDPAPDLYFIRRGIIRGYSFDDEDNERIQFFKSDDQPCFAARRLSQPYIADFYLQALEVCYLYTIPIKQLNELAEGSYELCLAIRSMLEDEMRAQGRIISLVLQPKKVDRIRQLKEHFFPILGRVSSKLLANFIGVSEIYMSNKKDLLFSGSNGSSAQYPGKSP